MADHTSEKNDVDYDHVELQKYLLFARKVLQGSNHPDDVVASMHLYSEYRKKNEEIENKRIKKEIVDIDDTIYDDHSMTSAIEEEREATPDDQCSQIISLIQGSNELFECRFEFPNGNASNQGYLIGFFCSGESLQALAVTQDGNDNVTYYPVLMPSIYFPKKWLKQSVPFLRDLAIARDLQSSFTEGRGHRVRKSNMDSLIVTGSDLISNHYCNQALITSLHNGLVMKDKARNYFAVEGKHKPVWYEEKENVSIDLYTMKEVTVNLEDGKAGVTIEIINSRSMSNAVKDIARAKKYQLCKKYRDLKHVLNLFTSEKVQEGENVAEDDREVRNSGHHSAFGRCLQYLLSGSENVRTDVGELLLCPQGDKICSCDVEGTEELESKVKVAINQRRSNCQKKKKRSM